MASGIAASELKVLRRNTKAFIDADDRSVVLLRPTRVPNGTGGTRPGPAAPLAAQTMRLLPQDASSSTERRMADGTVVLPTWVLLGTHDADMKRGDTFVMPDGTTTAEVVYVHEKKAYEVKGEVATRGPH